MIRKLVRKLPPWIVRVLRTAYNRWNYAVHIDRRMTRDLSEYFRVTYEQAVCLFKVGTRLNAEVWGVLCPQEVEQMARFYQLTPFYIFSGTYWHMSRAQRWFRREVVKLSKGYVLDYGGGIGDLSLMLAQAGLNVTYVDVGGKTFDFARWFLARRGRSDVLMLDIEKDWERIWARKYGTIICVDVIEHVPEPELVLARMAASLTEKGKLFITGLHCVGASDDHPMHLKITFDPDTLLN